MNSVRTGRAILLLFFLSPTLFGETISWGNGRDWNSVSTTGLTTIAGWRDGEALTVSPMGRDPFAPGSVAVSGDVDKNDIDLLLLAGPHDLRDVSGRYRVVGNTETTSNVVARGDASIRLRGRTIHLIPPEDGMFSPGAVWGDFTIEFRLRPTNLRDGEILLSWNGLDREGGIQSVVVRVENRRLVWTFKNFFRHPDYQGLVVKLESAPLIPGEWRHHLVRFRASEPAVGKAGSSGSPPGLVEYLVDGRPVDLTYATLDGREGAGIFIPRVGSASNQALVLGEAFTGFIDEIRISRAFVEDPIGGVYADNLRATSGSGVTETVDMGFPATPVESVRTRATISGSGGLELSILVTDDRDLARKAAAMGLEGTELPWIYLTALREPEDPAGGGNWYRWTSDIPLRGRFFVLGFRFLVDPGEDTAPILSSLEVSYEPRLPPRAPYGLSVEKTPSGEYTLGWIGIAEPSVTGWWLSWGVRPGEYTAPPGRDGWGGSVWIPADETTISGSRRLFTWTPPMNDYPPILYFSLKAAYKEGEPVESGGGLSAVGSKPRDLDALSPRSEEVSVRP